MKLVLFTAHYPFGQGESFLEEEIRVTERYFERIIIVSYEREERELSRYVPANASVIQIRKNMGTWDRLRKGLPFLFRKRMWKEFLWAKKNTPYSLPEILSQLFLAESLGSILRSHRKEWMENDRDTVYYSYWLGTEFAFADSGWKGLKISRAHGGDCFFDRGYHPYRREALRNLDFVFPISEAGCRDIVSHYEKEVPNLAEKVKTARMGISIPEKSAPVSDGGLRTIVTCSNIIPLKRLDLMVDALQTIHDMNLQWIHFGDGSLKEQILRKAENQLGTQKNIRFDFRGYTPNAQIRGFYQSVPVDLFVNCSDVEGIPVSVMEAMACGIPAIGRDVGGMGELIDGSCGLLLPEQTDAAALAAAMREILCLPSERHRKLRAAARERIEKRFDAVQNYNALFAFIKGCLYADD